MPHPSVPDNQTGWVTLGTITTDTAMLAMVAPEMAGLLSDTWTPRYLGEDGQPLPPADEMPEHELIEFEELQLGDEGDRAVLLAAAHDIAQGAQALSEIDFARLCRSGGLPDFRR